MKTNELGMIVKDGKREKKKRKPIKQRSAQAAAEAKALSQFYKDHDEQWGYDCEGCGGVPINHSHTLPKGNPIYKKYATTFANVHKMCANCHNLVEIRQWESLLCKDKMIDFVAEVEPDYLASVQLGRLDQILIIEEERMWLTNNANLRMLNANSDGTIQIIDLEENKLFGSDNLLRKLSVIE